MRVDARLVEEGVGVCRYRYNGKELNEELGLYDYGARNYDPTTARWLQVDPLAGDYASMSPYNYVLNNPLIFIDPDGMRVNLSNMFNSDGADVGTIAALLFDLASITGNNISVDVDRNLTMSEGDGNGEGSKSAASYLQSLIDSDETITASPATVSKENPTASTGVLTTPGASNDIQMNAAEMWGHARAGEEAGLDRRNLSIGMQFLHETTHTKLGSSIAGGSMTSFDHQPDWWSIASSHGSKLSPGRAVHFVNTFRSELGIAEK